MSFLKRFYLPITAFWASVAVAAAAALIVAVFPVALTAVVGFAIAGVSIASLVGSGFIAQVAAVAVLAAVATSASVFITAGLFKAFDSIQSWFNKTAPKGPTGPTEGTEGTELDNLNRDSNDSNKSMREGLSNIPKSSPDNDTENLDASTTSAAPLVDLDSQTANTQPDFSTETAPQDEFATTFNMQ